MIVRSRSADPGHGISQSGPVEYGQRVIPARPKVWFTAVVLACVTGPLSAPGAASARKPDLVQTSVSDPPAEIAAGASLKIKDRVRNQGSSVARPSKTRYYLSVNRERGPSDTRLHGRRSVPRLRPGRASTGSKTANVPVTAPLGNFRLIACADDPGDVRERRAHNNCLASGARVRVTLPATCRERLERMGIAYSSGPQQPGVADPVTIGLPLNGISYFAAGEVSPQNSLFMDCSLALALHQMAETLEARGITAVEHFGVYGYRCIAGTDPCVLSQHAHATAIDLHEFRTGAGETYNVETDWVIDPDTEATCSALTLGPKDTLLARACLRVGRDQPLPRHPHAELQRGASRPLSRRPDAGPRLHRLGSALLPCARKRSASIPIAFHAKRHSWPCSN